MTVILGIDPGSRITGYGVIQKENKKLYYLNSGCIRIKNNNFHNRLQYIYSEISNIIVKFKPNCLAIEQLFISKNANSALKLGQALGVLIVAAMNLNLPVFEYANKKVKSIVVGNGSAKKKQVECVVKNILKLSINLIEDESDALAIAIAHYLSFYKKIRKSIRN